MPRSGLRLAMTLLTAIPLNGTGAAEPSPSRQTAGAAMAWAPAVGLLLGAAAAAVLELAARWGRTGPLLAAVLAVTALALLTRCLHLDGLADLADGLGSRQPAGRALEIMKRSDIGPFGVVALVLTLAVQVAALAQAQVLGRGVPAVITAVVAGRLALTWACRRGVPAARGTGLGALVAGTVHPAVPAVLTAAAFAAAAAAGLIFGIALAAGLASALALTALAVRRLGGITGDVLGGMAEVTAAIGLLVTAIGRLCRRCRLQHLAETAGVVGRLVVVRVPGARPEEAPQPVALGPGHDVHVKMRDALADRVVHADETALRAQRGWHGRADLLHPQEQRADQVGGQVGERHIVRSRRDEHVPLEHRPGVEERDGDVVGEHHLGGPGSRDDVAERAIGHLEYRSPCS
jgi:adenosylcobinamide-GDP ribazoletransferase